MADIWVYHEKTGRTGLLVDFEQWPPPGTGKEPRDCNAVEWEARFYMRVAYSPDHPLAVCCRVGWRRLARRP